MLSTLVAEPTDHFELGPLRIEGLRMESDGRLCVDFHAQVFSFKFFEENICIANIFRDEDQNLVFKTESSSGLIDRFVPDFRILPDGTIQEFKGKRLLGILWEYDRRWRDLTFRGRKVDPVSGPIPICPPQPTPEPEEARGSNCWPMPATDLLGWFPESGPADASMESRAGAQDPRQSSRPDIPITRAELHFLTKADQGVIRLPEGAGELALTGHEISLDLEGAFKHRFFKTADHGNNFRFNLDLAGRVDGTPLGLDIRHLGLAADGALKAEFHFDELSDFKVTLDAKSRLEAALDSYRAALGDFSLSGGKGLKGHFNGQARLELKPLLKDRQENILLTVDRENTDFSLSLASPLKIEKEVVTLGGSLRLPAGITLLASQAASSAAGPDEILFVKGKMGTRTGLARPAEGQDPERFKLVYADADYGLGARSSAPLGIRGGAGLEAELGDAEVRLKGRFVGGIGRRLIGGGLNVQIEEASLSGNLQKAKLDTERLKADIPGKIRFSTGLEASLRFRAEEGLARAVRRLALRTGLAFPDGDGRFELQLPGGIGLAGRIGADTFLEFNSGDLTHPAGKTALSTRGFDRQELGGTLGGTLLLDLTEGRNNLLRGKVRGDLKAGFGARFDPANLSSQRPVITDPLRLGLELGVEVGDGAVLSPSSTLPAPLLVKGPFRFSLSADGFYNLTTGETNLTRPEAFEVSFGGPLDLKLKTKR